MRSLITATLVVVALSACSSTPEPQPSGSEVPKASVLDGTEWLLMSGEGLDSPFGVTLQFGPGTMSGQGPVNRYSGTGIAAPDGTLEIGPLASTKMAGPEDRMAAEQTYFDLLGSADGWSADDWQLTLTRAGTPILQFSEPDSPGAFGISLIGDTVKKAKARATDDGYEVRVVSVDGDSRPATTDYRTNRLNLTVVDGRVTQVQVG